MIRRDDRARLSRADDPGTLAEALGDARFADIKNPMPVEVLRAFAAALSDCAHLRIRVYEDALDPALEAVNAFRGLAHARLWLLTSSSTKLDFDALDGHDALERVRLTFGGRRDLRWLCALPRLLDLELWRITKLADDDLAVLGETHLEALVVGAARHVTSLAFAPATLRHVELERVGGLSTFETLETPSLGTVILNESRPADRRLVPLTRFPLDLVQIGDVYPHDEVAELTRRFRGRMLWIRGDCVVDSPGLAPDLGWRQLLDHVDAERRGAG